MRGELRGMPKGIDSKGNFSQQREGSTRENQEINDQIREKLAGSKLKSDQISWLKRDFGLVEKVAEKMKKTGSFDRALEIVIDEGRDKYYRDEIKTIMDGAGLKFDTTTGQVEFASVLNVFKRKNQRAALETIVAEVENYNTLLKVKESLKVTALPTRGSSSGSVVKKMARAAGFAAAVGGGLLAAEGSSSAKELKGLGEIDTGDTEISVDLGKKEMKQLPENWQPMVDAEKSKQEHEQGLDVAEGHSLRKRLSGTTNDVRLGGDIQAGQRQVASLSERLGGKTTPPPIPEAVRTAGNVQEKKQDQTGVDQDTLRNFEKGLKEMVKGGSMTPQYFEMMAQGADRISESVKKTQENLEVLRTRLAKLLRENVTNGEKRKEITQLKEEIKKQEYNLHREGDLLNLYVQYAEQTNKLFDGFAQSEEVVEGEDIDTEQMDKERKISNISGGKEMIDDIESNIPTSPIGNYKGNRKANFAFSALSGSFPSGDKKVVAGLTQRKENERKKVVDLSAPSGLAASKMVHAEVASKFKAAGEDADSYKSEMDKRTKGTEYKVSLGRDIQAEQVQVASLSEKMKGVASPRLSKDEERVIGQMREKLQKEIETKRLQDEIEARRKEIKDYVESLPTKVKGIVDSEKKGTILDFVNNPKPDTEAQQKAFLEGSVAAQTQQEMVKTANEIDKLNVEVESRMSFDKFEKLVELAETFDQNIAKLIAEREKIRKAYIKAQKQSKSAWTAIKWALGGKKADPSSIQEEYNSISATINQASEYHTALINKLLDFNRSYKPKQTSYQKAADKELGLR